jgi:hypothetical protein
MHRQFSLSFAAMVVLAVVLVFDGPTPLVGPGGAALHSEQQGAPARSAAALGQSASEVGEMDQAVVDDSVETWTETGELVPDFASSDLAGMSPIVWQGSLVAAPRKETITDAARIE